MRAFLLAILLAISAPASAQPIGLDRPFTPLSTSSQRAAADTLSWVTVGAGVVLDSYASLQGHCSPVKHGDHADQVVRCFELQGVRVGATYGLVFAAKLLIHRDRPCAPACGSDVADQSFFSGHTALAFSTLGGPRLAIALPLAFGTGGLRIAAGKHYLSDVIVGAAVGALTSRIR